MLNIPATLQECDDESVPVPLQERPNSLRENFPQTPPRTQSPAQPRQVAKQWIIANQLGRRNLTPEAVSYLWGKQDEAEKVNHGGDRKSVGAGDPHKSRDFFA